MISSEKILRLSRCRQVTRFNSGALRHPIAALAKEKSKPKPSNVPDPSGITHSAVALQALGQLSHVRQVVNENIRADAIRGMCQEHTDHIAGCIRNLEEEASQILAVLNSTAERLAILDFQLEEHSEQDESKWDAAHSFCTDVNGFFESRSDLA